MSKIVADPRDILLTPALSNPSYAAPGYLVFFTNKTLFAQRFDAGRLALSGEASSILTDIQYVPRIGFAVFAVHKDGVLLAQGGSAVLLSRLQWFDRSGKELRAVGKPEVYANVALSPDGKLLALDKTDPANQNSDVWIYGLQGQGMKRMTFDPGIDAMPVWSPDGTRLAFSSSRNVFFNLYLKDVDGAQEEKAIEATVGADKWPNSWSPDGKHILYARGSELWTLTLPDWKSQVFLKGDTAFGPVLTRWKMGGVCVD